MKKVDDYLYLLGQDLSVEDLEEKSKETHEFSEKYQQKKQALLDSLDAETDSEKKVHKKGYRQWTRWAAAFAVVVLAGVGSVKAYGAYQKYVIEQGNKGNISQVNVSSPEEESENQQTVEGITVELGYVPEGYETWQTVGNRLYYSQNGDYAGVGFDVFWNFTTFSRMTYTETAEETEIQGFKAYLYSQNTEESDNTRQTSEIFMVNEEKGSTISLRGDSVISLDELKKIAENLKITYTGVQEVIDVSDGFTAERAYEEKAKSGDIDEQYRITSEMINTDGVFEWSSNKLTIKDVKITDSIEGLSLDSFYADKHVEDYINDDGTLKTVTRSWDVYDENGVHKEKDENVTLKCVQVTCEVTNKEEEADEFGANGLRMAYIYTDENGNMYEDEEGLASGYSVAWPEGMYDGQPSYLSPAQYDPTSSHYFFFDLEPGETKTYTIAYIVYADQMDNLYLANQTSGCSLFNASAKELLNEYGYGLMKVE